MLNKYIIGIEVDGKTAGSKAQKDINQITEEIGYIPIKYKILGNRIAQFLEKKFFKKKLDKISENSIILLQYPLAGNLEPTLLEYVEQRKDLHVILLIHDLDILRNSNNTSVHYLERKLLYRANKIIVHNTAMKTELLKRLDNLNPDNMVELEMFDYICDLPDNYYKAADKNAIVIAGNLNKEKSGYVYKLGKTVGNLTFHLYGINYAKNEAQNAVYHGSYQPEELPIKMERGFGLVWDGGELHECSGSFGEYLKYNNPHKLSLYIAAGIPVIVWSQAASRLLVEKERIGFTIDSIADIENKISMLPNEEYHVMTQNAMRLSKKVRNGYFTKRAVLALEEV